MFLVYLLDEVKIILQREKDYDTSIDNYYKNRKFVRNQYKTSKTNGEKSVDVKEKAPEFYKALSKWVKCNPSN